MKHRHPPAPTSFESSVRDTMHFVVAAPLIILLGPFILLTFAAATPLYLYRKSKSRKDTP